MKHVDLKNISTLTMTDLPTLHREASARTKCKTLIIVVILTCFIFIGITIILVYRSPRNAWAKITGRILILELLIFVKRILF